MQTMCGVSRGLSVLAKLGGFFKFGLNCPSVTPPIHITGKIGQLASRSGMDIVIEFYSTVYRTRGRCPQERVDFPQRQCALIGVILVRMPAQAHRSPIPQHQDRLGLDVGVGEIEGLTVWRKHSFGGEFKVKTGGAAYL